MGKYTLKIDLNVLNHLGLNLYSNVPAVLSELIANAWDADATEVRISTSSEEIRIEDNGCGMNESDLNNKFLNVGHQRRKSSDKDLTNKLKRPVMGRKGIGKLSIFSISEQVKVYTKQDVTLGISMNVEDIQEKISAKQEYSPEEFQDVDVKDKIAHPSGTTIVLNKIKKRVSASIDNNLKKRIARRFDIFSDNFKVYINDSQVSVEDRDYFNKLEFATVYGNYLTTHFKSIGETRIQKRGSMIEGGYEISGWIGLVKESGGLQDGADNINKISILARGKVASEDILELYRDGGLYTKFLIGEIRADFLDSTEQEDIATSSRQDFIQNDERFIRLKAFIEKELKHIRTERAKYKEEDGVEKASEIPAIKEWFANLTEDKKGPAKKLFGKINRIDIGDKNRKILYQHGVLAFEHLEHKGKLQQLGDLDVQNLEATVKLFSEIDDIEASWYYQITKGRLNVIKILNKHLERNALEKIIQNYIYKHLWLVDPAWDRATETPTMEESIKNELGKLNLTQEEKNGRLDIRYKKVSGKHVIIELKRDSVKPKTGELLDQVEKYRSAVEKQLLAYKENGAVEVICLVGQGLSGWESIKKRQEDENALAAKDISVKTYRELITNAENAYRDYLNEDKRRGRISKLLDEINNSDP